MVKANSGNDKMKFDYCIQVFGDNTIYMVDNASQSKIPIKHWGDYIALGKPTINMVVIEDANRLKTVKVFKRPETAAQRQAAKKIAQRKATQRKSVGKNSTTRKFVASLSPAESSSVLVIIPTLNRPLMCRRAIVSLLKQKFTNWSLVIAKNGKTHAEEYYGALHSVFSDPKITYLELPGQGLGYALNEGVALRGNHTYFAILEDDDEWDSGFLLRLVAIGDSTQGDIIHCKQRQTPIRRQGDGAPMVRKDMHEHNGINFPMCLFRANLVERVGQFCNEAGPATDWDWNLRCIDAGMQYIFVPEVLVTHHWHSGLSPNYCLTHNADDFIRARQKEGVYGELVHKSIQKMRIVYVLPGLGPSGGVRVVVEHANGLAARGHTVFIATPVKERRPKWIDVNVPLISVSDAFRIPFDVAVATGHETVKHVIGISAKRKFYFVQMMEYMFYSSTSDNGYIAAMQSYSEAKDHGLQFITIAEWLRKILEGKFGVASTVVPNGVDKQLFYPGAGKQNAILLEGDNRNPAKDTECIAWKVAKRLRQEFGVAVTAFAASRPPWVNDVDKFIFRPSSTQMRQLYSSARLILKVTHYEGRSLAPLEAMCCGTPTVRGIIEGDDDLIHWNGKTHTGTAWRVGYNEEGVYEGAAYLLRNEGVLRQLTENVKIYAKDHLGWEPIIEKLERIYTGG